MIYVGVDVAKADHCLGAMDAQAKVVVKPVGFTQDAEGFATLAAHLRRLGPPSDVMVGMEATGHYWVLLAEELRRLGYEPQVFNPILSSDAGRTTVRGRKTDADDCLAIAKVLRDGGFTAVQMPDATMGELKRLCRYRQLAVERSANLKKRLIGYLDLVFPEFERLFSDCHGPTGRAVLASAGSARLMAECKAGVLSRIVQRVSRGQLGLEQAQKIITAAKASIAVGRSDTATELAIRMTLQEIELLEGQIATYDAQIRPLGCTGKQLLTTIPGVGPILAAVIMAEIGSIERFIPGKGDQRPSDGIHRLLAFAGLDPRVRQSGQWTGKSHMSKRGSRALRTAIWRAAFAACRHEAYREVYERHLVTMKQPQKVALSHVARKVVQAIYGVLRHKKDFNLDAFRGKPRNAA
jgi:transposase